PQAPPTESLNATCLLQVHVQEARPSGLRLKTYLSEKSPSPPPETLSGADNATSDKATPDKLIEVFVSATGAASEIKGLDQLSSAQRNAWPIWLNRFTAPMTFPKSGVRPGRRWRIDEPETATSPIAELSWERKYEYAKSGPCLGFDRPPTQNSC